MTRQGPGCSQPCPSSMTPSHCSLIIPLFCQSIVQVARFRQDTKVEMFLLNPREWTWGLSTRSTTVTPCMATASSFAFSLLLSPQMMGKLSAGISVTNPHWAAGDNLSSQLLGALLAACRAMWAALARAPNVQGTKQSQHFTFLQRSFHKGYNSPHLQQLPLQGTHNGCNEKGSSDFFIARENGKGGNKPGFFSSFSCTKGSLFISIAGSLTQQSALPARQGAKGSFCSHLLQMTAT